MKILIKETRPDSSQFLVYIMDGNTPIEAHILKSNELYSFVNSITLKFKLNALEVERMAYNDYIKQ